MPIVDEFVNRVALLKDLNFEEASGRLVGLLDWMEGQPQLRNILTRVRKATDGVAILQAANFYCPPRANTPEQIASVGLALIEACRNAEFGALCHARGIAPSYQTNRVQAFVDEAMERYIAPLLVYIDRELDRGATDYVLDQVADRKFDEILLNPDFAGKFPVTHAHLERLNAEFVRNDSNIAWQNVGNSCRQVILEFCSECCSVLQLSLPDDTKRGDAKAIIREVIRRVYSGGRFATALESLVNCVWDYAQSITHRTNATRDEALRVYLWTGLAIDEIANLIPTASARITGNQVRTARPE